MELALQVPEFLERYDALDTKSPTILSEAETLLSDCERLDHDYRNWYTDSLQPTTPTNIEPYSMRPIDSFPTFAALIPNRTLSNGFIFADSQLSFLYRQHWCCQYFLQSTIARLREYLQAFPGEQSRQHLDQPCSTNDSHIDNLVFSLCRCIPGLAEPVTGAHGHIAIFLPLRIALMHFRSRGRWDWVRWAEDVSVRVLYRGIRPPAINHGDYPEARSLVVAGPS